MTFPWKHPALAREHWTCRARALFQHSNPKIGTAGLKKRKRKNKIKAVRGLGRHPRPGDSRRKQTVVQRNGLFCLTVQNYIIH